MDELTRAASMERGGINLETGEFPMILATEGEAMDGHILSIKGMELPERMPPRSRFSSLPPNCEFSSFSGATFRPGRKRSRVLFTVELARPTPLSRLLRRHIGWVYAA